MTPVHAAISLQYTPPEYATFFEVRDAAGWKASRSADAIVMSLWPSRGLTITGYEVKVDRRDWLRELKDPAKSGPVQRYCDFWYIAVDREDIVKKDELPKTWGLKILSGKKLVTKVEAPALEATPLTKDFLATILRRASEDVIHKSVFDERLAAELDLHIKSRTTHEQLRLTQLESDFKYLKEEIRNFEEASGVSIRNWPGSRKVGEAVKFLLEHDEGLTKRISYFRSQLSDLNAQADKALAELQALDKQYPPRRRVTPG